jgi:hypothetical protein
MPDTPRPTDHPGIDPERTRLSAVDDDTSYSGQDASRTKEAAVGRDLRAGSVKRPEGFAMAPPQDDQASGEEAEGKEGRDGAG